MTNMLEETEDISISALISDTNQISDQYSIFKDSPSIEAIFFYQKREMLYYTLLYNIFNGTLCYCPTLFTTFVI